VIETAPASRFAPPPLVPTAEVRWLLLRAFGPVDADCAAPEPAAALAMAQRSGLAPRIAARTPDATLDAELGDAAEKLAEARRLAASHALAYEGVIEAISRVADAIPTPVVLLKGAALHAAGWVAADSRTLGDLDVLVDAGAAQGILAGLEAAGFVPGDGPRNEQHLPPLVAPGWGLVDVHDGLRGVGDATGRWLDASAALAVGEPLEYRPACWVPERTLLAAHTLVHGLEQHAWSPNPYPLLRTLGDLQDLLPGAAAWRAALPGLAAWLRQSVAEAEIGAARDLCLALARGGPLEDLDAAPATLLAHFLAYSLDDAYRAGLRGRHHRHRLAQAWRRGTLLRYAGRKLSDWWRRAVRR
jgi:Uncharacterised nucleotidyltransferase